MDDSCPEFDDMPVRGENRRAGGSAARADDGAATRDIMATAVSWKCRCQSGCRPADAAHCLYSRTLDALSYGRSGASVAASMIGELDAVVGWQKSAEGHGFCLEYLAALETDDAAAALDACMRLIELAETNPSRGWDESPGYI